jgi:hypothetical protein
MHGLANFKQYQRFIQNMPEDTGQLESSGTSSNSIRHFA